MNLDSFTDELLRIGPGEFSKVARLKLPPADARRLYQRLGLAGGLAGLGGQTIDEVKAGLTANPYDAPRTGYAEAAKKGALGGLLAALGLRGLGKLTRRGR